jgi:predicted PurR-regulated permease PerM
VLVIILAVLISGFLYFPGPRFVTGFRAFAARVVGVHGSDFVDLAGATIRNVARGVIGVAAIQALLTGVGLIVAGVPGAGLLTLAVLILAILQIGSGPVVIPLLIWAWLQMSTGAAVLLTAYMIPVSIIDNILKPILMGKGLPTPMLVILVGVIGGTISYGLIGLFLGPIVLAVFYELLVFWVAAAPAAAPPPAPAAEAAPPDQQGGEIA